MGGGSFIYFFLYEYLIFQNRLLNILPFLHFIDLALLLKISGFNKYKSSWTLFSIYLFVYA